MAKDSVGVYVYIIDCMDSTIYTGITNNISRRMTQHKGYLSGGAHYTKTHGFKKLLGFRKYRTRSEAMKEELRIKRTLTSKQKREIVKSIGWVKF